MSSSLSFHSSSESDWSSSSSYSSPTNPKKVLSERTLLSLSPQLKVGGYSSFPVFSLESVNSSRVVRTNSSTIETIILVGLVWFFFVKYGIVSILGINIIALTNFQVMGQMV